MTEEIKKLQINDEVDAIACRGLSGLMVAGPLSLRTRLPVIAVRREKEQDAHSYDVMANTHNGKIGKYRSFVIVDDLISTGKTICHIIKEIHKSRISESVLPKCILLYEDDKTEFMLKKWVMDAVEFPELSRLVGTVAQPNPLERGVERPVMIPCIGQRFQI
jgi:orotate phosphoribosyltransferase